ncbi:MAG: four helix bundle suffix domain-containing protein [Muribaculaceae bacterium]|jgi:four helix bundle suffix protein|nr:four helix bundle suffix domain-containing protein [Muribaculaceae bacterium]MBQ2236230.1 four helix bundle suffix domain-containing protein [Muribaculaceae bacterium]MBQ2484818.1 four helix bundle suffix domain-containing protein [Muribaculaceae bacterium]
MERFLPNQGNYQSLIVYQKAECIYDITYYFAHKYLDKGDRTIDQMIQAARSGKQNIAEGSAASATSSETELKLINVAKASLHELLVDYEDYLRVRQLQQWAGDDPRSVQTRKVCAKHNDSAFYRSAIETRSAETIANIAITLIHQEDFMLRNLLNRLQDDFVKHGGIKERMFQARLNYRNKTGDKK